MRCEMVADCPEPVAYLDAKGYVYCAKHGRERQRYQNCRKLRQYELNRLSRGETISHY